jgi:hypothetical protein
MDSAARAWVAGVPSATVNSAARQAAARTVPIGTPALPARARTYRSRRLGSLGALHAATADPFLRELTGFVTYHRELAEAAADLGFPVLAPGLT